MGNLHLLVMEFVEGWNLADVVQGKGRCLSRWPVTSSVRQRWACSTPSSRGWCTATSSRGNLMLTPQGRVKILDFGLARLGSEKARRRGLTDN